MKKCYSILFVLVLLVFIVCSCGKKSADSDNDSAMDGIFESVLKEEKRDSAYYKEKIRNAVLVSFGDNGTFKYNVYDEFVEIVDESPNTSLASVEFPDNIEGLPVWVVRGSYDRVRSVKFPRELREMRATFRHSRFSAVTIPDSTYYVCDYAFAVSDLYSLNLGEGVEEIGDYAFAVRTNNFEIQSDTHLTEVILPASLKKVGERAFRYQKNLKKVSIHSMEVVSDDDKFEVEYIFQGAAIEELQWRIVLNHT